MRRNPAEQRWPKHDTGKHFTHHARLMDFLEQFSDHAAHRQNHRQLQNKGEQVRHQCAPPFAPRGCLTARNSTGVHDGQPTSDSTPLIDLGSALGSTVAANIKPAAKIFAEGVEHLFDAC